VWVERSVEGEELGPVAEPIDCGEGGAVEWLERWQQRSGDLARIDE
jgi:hypothetical protein